MNGTICRYHKIDTTKTDFTRNPICRECGIKLCSAKNSKGSQCMLPKGHNNVHQNKYLDLYGDSGPLSWE